MRLPITSLKDFNEYSVLCRDREILWQCLEHVLDLRGKISAEVRTFLEEVLDAGEGFSIPTNLVIFLSILSRR